MKSYMSDKQIRLVGKAWEVRHQLQQMLQQAGPSVTVADYLAGLNTPMKSIAHGSHRHSARILAFPMAAI